MCRMLLLLRLVFCCRGVVCGECDASIAVTMVCFALLPGLVDGATLGYTVVVTLPYDAGVCRKGQHTLDGLAAIGQQVVALSGAGRTLTVS